MKGESNRNVRGRNYSVAGDYMQRSPMSRIVKAVLILRGSKRLFSSEKRARKALDKARVKPVDYRLKKPEKLKSRVEESYIHATRYYVFTKKEKGAACGKSIIYLHGGAFLRSPTSAHWKYVDKLVQESGAKLIFPIYPKIPQHNYKDTYAMLFELYKELLTREKSEDIIFMGDSAGGNIVLSFALLLKKEKLPQPGQIICHSPCAELSFNNADITKTLIKSDPMLGLEGLKLFVEAWAGGMPLDNPVISPLYGDLSGIAPLAVFIGTDELLLPDVRLFKEKAKKAGVQIKMYEYQYMNHCFFLFPLKEARDCFEKTLDVLWMR